MDALKQRIRHVPDFPKPGILFYDVTTLLKDREGFGMAVEAMAEPHRSSRDRRRRRHREPRLHLRIGDRGSTQGGLRAGAQARQAAVEDAQGLLRARVRHRLARDSRGRRGERAARADRRRPARDRRHGRGDGRPRARPRRGRRRRAVSHRADVPQRTGEAQRAKTSGPCCEVRLETTSKFELRSSKFRREMRP